MNRLGSTVAPGATTTKARRFHPSVRTDWKDNYIMLDIVLNSILFISVAGVVVGNAGLLVYFIHRYRHPVGLFVREEVVVR